MICLFLHIREYCVVFVWFVCGGKWSRKRNRETKLHDIGKFVIQLRKKRMSSLANSANIADKGSTASVTGKRRKTRITNQQYSTVLRDCGEFFLRTFSSQMFNIEKGKMEKWWKVEYSFRLYITTIYSHHELPQTTSLGMPCLSGFNMKASS